MQVSPLIEYVPVGEPFLNWAASQVTRVCNVLPPDFTRLHRILGPESINMHRLNVFNELNSDFESGLKLLWSHVGSALLKRLGPDIAVQRRLNFSIHMPGDSDAILDAHSDSWSGETPFQMNLWIPITRVKSSNSLFLLTEIASSRFHGLVAAGMPYGKIVNDLVTANCFLELPPGRAVLFNSDLIHGNVLNATSDTRLSLNIRFKNFWAPESRDQGLGIRSRGNFFRPLIMSPNSVYALQRLGVCFEEPIVE